MCQESLKSHTIGRIYKNWVFNLVVVKINCILKKFSAKNKSTINEKAIVANIIYINSA